jgi:hypothetical protein
MTFDDLDLKLFGDERSGHRVEVVGSRRSDPLPLVLPTEIQRRVERVRRRCTDRKEAERLGADLFEALLPVAIRQIWHGMTGPSQINRLRLDIRSRELMSLPWEMIWEESYLALSERTPIVRFLAESSPADQFEVAGPVNFLLVSATPSDLSPLLGVKDELDMIRRRLATNEAQITLNRLNEIEHVSLSALRAQLNDAHVVHYMGHGDFADDRGYLLLENPNGTSERQEAELIGNNMRDAAVRVLVLNACDTAIGSTDSSLIGVAHAAHKAGVPVVIGMQQTILDSAAPKFADDFYQALMRGKPIESCMVEGRLAIQRHTGLDSAEWAIPVMFSNAPTGKLCVLQWSRDAAIVQPAVRAKIIQGPVILGPVGRDVVTNFSDGHKPND